MTVGHESNFKNPPPDPDILHCIEVEAEDLAVSARNVAKAVDIDFAQAYQAVVALYINYFK